MGSNDPNDWDDLELGEDAPLFDADPELIRAFYAQRHKQASSKLSQADQTPLSTTLKTAAADPSAGQADDDSQASAARYGLQTAEQLRESKAQRQAAHCRRLETLDPQVSGRDSETVYRSKTGRKADLAAERAEEATKRRREEERQMLQMEWGKGVVQRQAKEAQQQQLEAEKHRPLARHADDKELNDYLKNRSHWDDPAAKFSAGRHASKRRRPTYQGPAPPANRFGIAPGYRWDGVDRSSGFEAEYFKHQSQRTLKAQREYAYRTEDM
ncbi:Pre-mRNA-splicing factor cwc26 [Dimargaris verticillata]|uniref:Pre-mRNA-splicing factor cwc26 n=1 Tax=Dimargaris verticillata TaxID=2761393 RepID=A0A9W8B5I1_9FUNG|nr:Pre-mRNA-splicing factor cwc26 [Dimargaris verticillata]